MIYSSFNIWAAQSIFEVELLFSGIFIAYFTFGGKPHKESKTQKPEKPVPHISGEK
jgi:hypothetical protein